MSRELSFSVDGGQTWNSVDDQTVRLVYRQADECFGGECDIVELHVSCNGNGLIFDAVDPSTGEIVGTHTEVANAVLARLVKSA